MERETVKELSKLEKDKIKAKQKDRYKEVAEICNYKGVLYSSKGYFEEALEEHKEELRYCRLNKDVLGEAIACRKIGECFTEMEQFEKALKNEARYLKLAEMTKNDVEIQRAWTTLGRTYLLQYSSDTNNKQLLDFAETAIKKSLKLAEKLRSEVNERDLNEMVCRSYLNLALICEAKEKNQCIQFFERAMLIARKFGFKEDLHRCQLSLGNFYLKLEDFTAALKVFDDAIKIAKELKNKAQLCDAYLSKGQTLLFTTDFAGASYYFKKAYFCFSTVEEDREKSRRLSKYTSCVVKNLKKLDDAVCLEEKMELCEKLGDSFAALKCYRTAIKYYEKQLHYARSLNKRIDMLATIHVSLGQTFLDNKQYAEALHHFTEERKLRKGNAEEEVNSTLKIIETMIAFGTRKEDIKKEYDHIVNKVEGNRKLKRIVLEDYLCFLNSEPDYIEKKNEIEKVLKGIPRNNNEDEEMQNDPDENLSEPSDFTDSDSDNEETYNRNRRSRKKRMNRNEKGETPLHKACIEGNIRQVRQLIEKGHSVNERDNCGWLPIHEAANFGFSEVVEYLIDKGADLNDRGGKFCEGITPLHDACINGHVDVVRVLIRKGANVASQDNNGNTALDCLKNYYSRAENLSQSEKFELEAVISELKEAMRKVSYDFNQPKRNSKKRNRFIQFEEPREKSPENVQTFHDTDLEDPFVSDYAQTISNLRRPVECNHDNKRRRLTQKITGPLLDESDVIIDDWLEDDIGLTKKNSSHALQNDHLKRKFGVADNKRVNSTENSFSDSSNKVSERVTSAKVCDTSSDCTDNFSGEVQSCAASISDVNIRNQSSRGSCNINGNTVVRVFVEDIVLLVNAEKGATVKWLAETTASRYYQVKQVLPSVCMKTRDGALLSSSDLVENVALAENGQLYATVESWESQPLNERYIEQCKLLSVNSCKEIKKEMKIAFETGKLNLRNFVLKENQLKPLLNAIKYQETIENLDISYSNILILDFRNEFLGVVMNLPRLRRLNVEGTLLTKSKLKIIANSKCKIFDLNLSYNCFKESYFSLIAQVITNFVHLKVLNLKHCELGDKFIVDSSVAEALTNASLCEILFDASPAVQSDVTNRKKWNFKSNYSSALKKITSECIIECHN